MATLPLIVRQEVTKICYVCKEIRRGLNQREEARLLKRVDDLFSVDPARMLQQLRALTVCRFCRRPVCGHHWFRVRSQREERHMPLWLRCCRECHALKYLLSGLGGVSIQRGWSGLGGVSIQRVKSPSFRQRWRLFRWRVTKRRLVERLQIGRVVVNLLPKDLANLVATYAVK